MACGCGDIFLGVIAILFPPIAVWIKSGICSADSLINILLCMLGYIPGLLHAWYIISLYPERDHDYEPVGDAEQGQGQGQNGRVTYYYIRHEEPNANRQYGTAGQGRAQGQPKPQQGAALPGSARPAEGSSTGAGGDEAGAPPSYSEVVKGDNKVQSRE